MRLLLSLTAAAACLACSLTANADPILSVKAFDVTSGSTAIALSSSTSTSGFISASGTTGNFPIVNITSSGAAYANGGLSTTTLDASGVVGTSLLLEITQTGLTAAQATQLFDLSYTLNALTAGSAGGSVNYTSYIDPTNSAFGTTNTLNAHTLNGSSSVAQYKTTTSASGLTPNGLYSETQFIKLNFTSAGTMTASAQLIPTTATPEPSSLALLGTGLLGIAGMARRRFSRS